MLRGAFEILGLSDAKECSNRTQKLESVVPPTPNNDASSSSDDEDFVVVGPKADVEEQMRKVAADFENLKTKCNSLEQELTARKEEIRQIKEVRTQERVAMENLEAKYNSLEQEVTAGKEEIRQIKEERAEERVAMDLLTLDFKKFNEEKKQQAVETQKCSEWITQLNEHVVSLQRELEISKTSLFSSSTFIRHCSLCSAQIMCSNEDMSNFTIHMQESHNQRACPMCYLIFDEDMENINKVYTNHVEKHFHDH